MTDLIKLYNPASAAALTTEQIEGLQKLSDSEIKELAKAYPNSAMAYLLIIDSTKPVDQQLPSLSTFENLYNLRAKHGLKNFVAFNFQGNYNPPRYIQPAQGRVQRSEVIDLSDSELLSLPGFKTAPFENIPEHVEPEKTVTVTKVKKELQK